MSEPARLPGPGPASPDRVAQALLDGIVEWFADNTGDDYPELPERRYVAGGDPRTVAWDTTAGQLTVCLSRILIGLDATRPPAPGRVPRSSPANAGRYQLTAVYEVQLVRCAPGLAGADVLHAHGMQVSADSGNLIRAVLAIAKAGQLTRAAVAEAGVGIEDLVTLGPDGGASAAAVGVSVPLL